MSLGLKKIRKIFEKTKGIEKVEKEWKEKNAGREDEKCIQEFDGQRKREEENPRIKPQKGLKIRSKWK